MTKQVCYNKNKNNCRLYKQNGNWVYSYVEQNRPLAEAVNFS